MAVIFYYVKEKDIGKIKDRGLDVLEFSGKTAKICGEQTPCIKGLLNPKDDLEKYNCNDFICLELEVNIEDCFAADGDLDFIDNEKYNESIIPLKNYKFGSYRKPDILITKNINSESINTYNKLIGSPILFERSDHLYKINVFEELRHKYDDFEETLLGIFFMLMTSKGRFHILGQKYENGKTIYVYKDVSSGKIYSLDIREGANNGQA